MAIDYYDAGNGDGLFQVLGKIYQAIDTINTARRTTIPTDVNDVLTQFKNLSSPSLDLRGTLDGLAAASSLGKRGLDSLTRTLRQKASDYLIQIVEEDADQPVKTLTNALEYLIKEMTEDSYYVVPNVVSLALAANAANIGDPAIVYTTKRGDGLVQEHAIPEVLTVEVTGDASALTPTLQFRGKRAISDLLSEEWPNGSGINTSLAAVDASSSLLSNGDFEDETIASVPDNWIVRTGQLGYTVQLSRPEIQTVVISGSPTGGGYYLRWSNGSVTRSTTLLAYNASQSTVQTALRAIAGLAQVTVATTGTTPNFTHTITFTGVLGDISQLTSLSYLTGGSGPAIAHATTQGGNAGAYKGKALVLNSDGSELTSIYHPLTLADETVYFCHFRAKRVTGEEESSSSSCSSSNSSSSSSSNSSSSSSSSQSSSSSSSSSCSASSVSSSSCSNSSSSSVNSSSSSSSSSSSVNSSSSSSSVNSSSSSSSVNSSSSSSSSVNSSSSSSCSNSSSSSSSSCSSLSSSSSSSVNSSSSGSSSSSSSSSSSELGDELRVEIVDGIDGTVTLDKAGNQNVLRVNVGSLSTSTHESFWFSFRLARSYTQPVYLRVRVVAPWPAGDSVYLDEMAVALGNELYPGGPFVQAFSGRTPAVNGDKWDLTASNTRAGTVHEWSGRVFQLASKRLLLPSTGTTQIPNSVVS